MDIKLAKLLVRTGAISGTKKNYNTTWENLLLDISSLIKKAKPENITLASTLTN